MASKPADRTYKCYALYRKTQLLDIYRQKGKAVGRVNKILGDSDLSRQWETNGEMLRKGKYSIVSCRCAYNRVFAVEIGRIHSENSPTLFPTADDLCAYMKDEMRLGRVNLKERRTEFTVSTSGGEVEGKIIGVK